MELRKYYGQTYLSPYKKALSKITIGEDPIITIRVDKKFNWFQRKMIHLCFGFEVQNI